MPQVVEIERFVSRLTQEFHPEKVILFGSYARGDTDDASDVDLLVIMPFEGPAVVKAIEILERLEPRFPIDLLVRTPEQLRYRLDQGDFFFREIVEQGRVLHEASYA